MTDFILNTGSTETHKLFDRLPEIAQGFIEAAMFCGVTDDNGDEFQPALDDLDPETFAGLAGEAIRFAKENAAALEAACRTPGYDMTQAGHDLWFSRNGHGTGYWDRGIGEAGIDLDAAAARAGNIDLYGDAGGPVTLSVHLDAYDPADLLPDQAPDVGGRYGAPMGRDSYPDRPGETVTARRVRLDEGGYDAGGAYWGLGAPLWRLTAQDGTPLGFVRAKTASDAMIQHANKGN